MAKPKNPRPRNFPPQKREPGNGSQVGAEPAKRRGGRPPGKAAKPPLPNIAESHDDQLLTIDQVRQFLAISDWFTRRLIKENKLPGVFLGGNVVRIRLGDLRAFIAKHRRRGHPGRGSDDGEGDGEPHRQGHGAA